jgi:hypothetical protein
VSVQSRHLLTSPKGGAIAIILLLLLSLFPLTILLATTTAAEAREVSPWYGDSAGWNQYQHTPTHNSSMPAHGPNGGPGDGNVSEVSILGTISHPVINWNSESLSSTGADGYGSSIGDFSNSITAPPTAATRCGQGHLFAVMVVTENSGGDDRSILKIVEGDTSKTAWRVNLGVTQKVKAIPILHDIDFDGELEILIAYDTASELVVDVWSPKLTCSEAGWQSTGHSTEMMWSWQDSDRRLGIDSPHLPVESTGHLVSTQPLLADLQMDGTPELVIAAIDQDTSNPVVIALPLPNQGPPDPLWSVSLDRGTHISDPAWVALDSLNSAILVTTIESSNANMWVWRIDGSTGSLDWERVTLPNGDTDSDSPRVRLPGPVIVQLDDDEIPEVIFTIPTDGNGRSSGSGATLVAWELTAAEEIWSFRTPNGYADAPPLPIDTDGDGIHDRVCWVTWYSTSQWNFDRQGMVGCHDLDTATPSKVWHRTLEQGSGNDNDEIAVSPPIWVDIDGFGEPEVIVSFGRRVFAFDGNSGLQADINSNWADALDMPHRVWSAPAAGDLDGDGYLDLLVGDTVVSTALCDVSPTSDGRGLSFNPQAPNPGEVVTITAQFANIGTHDCDSSVDAVLYVDDVEVGRFRVNELEPIAPTGDAGPSSFSADITAQLGTSQVKLVLDPYGNLSQSRLDNDNQTRSLLVLKPYDAEISIPPEPLRIAPGSSGIATPTITATGRSTANWTLFIDSTNLPENWTVVDETVGGLSNISIEAGSSWSPSLRISIPASALGDQAGYLALTLRLDEQQNISIYSLYPVEVLRTRGLSVLGPDGTGASHGLGLPGHDAVAWILIENLGNAADSTTTLSWDSNSWGTSPSLRDMAGNEHHIVHMQPGEQAYYAAHLPVPSSIALGSSTTTSLQLCVGQGADKLCETVELRFTANGVSVAPPHHRVTPDEVISFHIKTSSSGLSWDLQSAGMYRTDWQWTVGGDLDLQGNDLVTTAAGASEGWLNLSMPATATPQLHIFNMSESGGGFNNLNLSVQVLQVHRAQINLIEPASQPWTITVGQEHTVVLRLNNPGNGADIYQLSAKVIANENFTSDPGLSFNLYDPEKSIAAGAMQTVLVGITLPLEMPARAGLLLEIELLSLGNITISDSVNLVVEAEPDHRWEVTRVGNPQMLVSPDEDVIIDWSVKNTGNYADDLNMTFAISSQLYDDDDSQWMATVQGSEMLGVNQSSQISLTLKVPQESWNGTIVTIEISFNSSSFVIAQDTVTLEVKRNAGWSFDISSSMLEVAPDGGNITVELTQLGNLASQPFITGSIYGWNVTFPDNLPEFQPFSSAEVTIFVTPPADAMAGEVGELVLIAQDGDGLGEVQSAIPLRVGVDESVFITTSGTWKVSSAGGMPLAWISNDGNTLANVAFALEEIPLGWQLSVDGVATEGGNPSDATMSMMIAAGQSVGIPLHLTPPTDWDGNSLRVTIVIDLNGEVEMVNITLQQANVSWANSPYISGIDGDDHELQFHGEPISGSGDLAIEQRDGRWWVTIPATGGGYSAQMNNENSSESLDFFISSSSYPSRVVACTFNSLQVSTIGSSAHNLSAPLANCVVANGSSDFRATITITTSGGQLVTGMQIYVLADMIGEFNLTTSDWTPVVGVWTLNLDVYQNTGSIIEHEEVITTIRAEGWNIGISLFDEIELGGNSVLRIGISRSNYQIMTSPDCLISITEDGSLEGANGGAGSSKNGGWSTSALIDVTAVGFAPEINLDRPSGLTSGSKLIATISCAAPWDVDDDSSDDTATLVLSEQTDITEAVTSWIWSAGVAVILIGIMWKLNLLWPQEKSTIVRSKKGSQKKPVRVSSEQTSQSGKSRQAARGNQEVEVQIVSTPGTEKSDAVTKGLPEDMLTEPSMEAAPPTSIIAKYRTGSKSDDGGDIDSRIDRMLSRKEFD